MKDLSWKDSKIEKPNDIDPVIGLTSKGYVVTVQWDWKRGLWYELATDEWYEDVVWWADYHLPKGWNISDDYYDIFPH